MKNIRYVIFILLIFNSSLFSKESQKVSLQLSWFNQFQFAGYFMAKEKGFYKDAGLDVSIKPFEFGLDIPQMVNENLVDFAIGRETLILDKIKNKNIVALYAIFQSSPLVLLSKEDSNINLIEDFKYKRIMTTISDAGEASIKAMIASRGVKLEDLIFLKHTHDINSLINNDTDVISAYISKTPFELQKRKISYNMFDPKEYGFDLYSDFLFTNKKYLISNTKLVEDFRAASLKGWEYAFSNINETVEIILNKYNTQNLTKNELIFEANELQKLAYFNTSQLGEIKAEKITRIHDLYNILGLIDSKIDLNGFIYTQVLKVKEKPFLSDEQKEYIKENPIVNMCTIPDIKPYSFIENNQQQGFARDYFDYIQELTNLKFRLIQTSSLQESIKCLKEGKCDILSGAEDTKARKNLANFTKPFINVPFALVTKADTTFIEDLSVIKDKRISLVKSYSAYEKIKKMYPNIDFIDVQSLDDGIQKVLDGENYGHIDLLYTSWYKIYTKDFSKLRISAKLDFSVPISIAVNKDKNELLTILDNTISKIDDKKRDEILKKWLTIEYKKETDYSVLYKIALVIFIIILAILYRQRILKKMNETLKEKVDEKSEELIKINLELEKRVKEEVEENLRKDRLLAQQSKMISMGQMIENIAHQWRQPLSLITTLASGIRVKKELNQLDDKYLDDSINSILKTSQYLSNTIDDFRYFFHPKKEKTNFTIFDCCKKSVDLVKPTFETKNILIKINSSDEIKINGYERELIQVIINILNNSKDALDNENIEDKIILIDILKINNNAVIEIKDNAGGIGEDIIDKIYEPYFTTKHSSIGTGIGLYMCQQIINKYLNGRISTKNVSFIYNEKRYSGALTSIILEII